MLNWSSQRIQVRVSYVDPLVAAGLTTVLSQQVDMEVVQGPAEEKAAASSPQVVVADYAQALTLAARREAQRRHQPQQASARPAVKVLVVTPNDREHDVRSALEAGVDGYLELGCDVGELLSGVRQLARGSRYLSQMAAAHIASSMGRSTLTCRELDVLCLVARGHSNKGVANKLDISEGTVKAHMKAILGKLNANTRTEAANIAQQRGLIADRATAS
jgi:DNA-binding NarL/FixJ family response regulator